MSSPHFSRRSFLKSTLAAGVAPLILPGRIWSAEVKPNDHVTFGCIGIGKQMRGLMSGFLSKPETQLVAVCDVDTTRAATPRATAGGGASTRSRPRQLKGYKGCAALQ